MPTPSRRRDTIGFLGAHTQLSAGTYGQGSKRRALFAFDIAGNTPAGSTVISATFKLDVVGVPSTGPPMNSSFELHRLMAGWDEGGGTGNRGSAANTGDVTWNSVSQNSSAYPVCRPALVGGTAYGVEERIG